jgi:ATP-dependent protease HslVU (ClpYQ) peptidase subunit
MTTIIAVQGDDFCVIGVDSRISTFEDSGYASQVMTLREGTTKVASNGKYLLGVAGDVRAINILHHVFQPPQPPVNTIGKKLDEFMTAKFIPILRECFEQQGYASPESNEEKRHIAEHDSTVLVAVNGCIYVIDGDYSWASDANGIYALGSGGAYAMGAMQASLGSKSKTTVPLAKALVLKALNISSRFDPYTGPPYYWFVQETNKPQKRLGRPPKKNETKKATVS